MGVRGKNCKRVQGTFEGDGVDMFIILVVTMASRVSTYFKLSDYTF